MKRLYLPVDGVGLSGKPLDSFLHPDLPDVTREKDEMRGQVIIETINLTHLRCVSSLGIVRSSSCNLVGLDFVLFKEN